MPDAEVETGEAGERSRVLQNRGWKEIPTRCEYISGAHLSASPKGGGVFGVSSTVLLASRCIWQFNFSFDV